MRSEPPRFPGDVLRPRPTPPSARIEWTAAVEEAFRDSLFARERRALLVVTALAAVANPVGTLAAFALEVPGVGALLPARIAVEVGLLAALVVAARLRTQGQVWRVAGTIQALFTVIVTLTAPRSDNLLPTVLAMSLAIWLPTAAFHWVPRWAAAAFAALPALFLASNVIQSSIAPQQYVAGTLFLGVSGVLAAGLSWARWRDARAAFLHGLQLDAARREAEASRDKLMAAQAQLVQAEKMASLGQLVAGVAHELNTPLGAIQASSSNLDDALRRTLSEVLPALAQLADDDRALLDRLLELGRGGTSLLSSRDARALRKRYQAALDAVGVPDTRSVAEQLVGLGARDDLGELAERLAAPGATAVLDHAAELHALRTANVTIRTAGSRASRVVQTLKHYAHPGGADAEPTTGDLATHLDTVLALMKHRLAGIELVRDDDESGVIWARHDELNQVWTNLVANAIEAMGGEGTLTVGVHGEADGVRVDVVDTGPGIPPEHRSRLFDPFFTTKGPGEGSGLGLSICHDIVEHQGGAIEVHSEPGRTVFSVRLPRTATLTRLRAVPGPEGP